MISLTDGERYTEPYPVVVFDNVLNATTYKRLLDAFPEKLNDARVYDDSAKYNKQSLSDRHQKEAFREILAGSQDWKEFYSYLRKNFAGLCVDAVEIDLEPYPSVRTLMEFSSLPAQGGGLLPHPDALKKVSTATMFFEPDWLPKWGGAFEVLRHKEDPYGNFDGRRADWDECETVTKVDVVPNRMVFFMRTPYSLHGVRPMDAPRPRRSITINLVAKNAKV